VTLNQGTYRSKYGSRRRCCAHCSVHYPRGNLQRYLHTHRGGRRRGTTIIIGLIQGTITLADFPKMLASSAKVNGVIVPIIAFSLPLAQTLAALEVPQGFVNTLTSLTDSEPMLILIMIGILILAGCVRETTPNIVILSPILLPLAQEIGMNEIHFCIMMVTSLGVGFITPPLGLNLFVVSGLTGTSILDIAGKAIPYVIAMFCVVLLLAFVPELSLSAIS